MLVLLRMLLSAAFLYAIYVARRESNPLSPSGDLTMAFYLTICVFLGLATAATWAPYIGEKLAGSITGSMVRGESLQERNWLLEWIRWLDKRQWRRLTVLFCFAGGVRQPDSPVAFQMGMRNARPGSWLERIFAREVYRFQNAQNCIAAAKILKQHGINPGPHSNPQINLVLMSLDKAAAPERPPMPVPPAPPPPKLERDARISLFDKPGDEDGDRTPQDERRKPQSE